MATIDRAPVRYSVRQADYDHEIGSRLRITLNGQGIREVIAYDTETGTLDCYATDPRGNYFVDPKTGEARVETLRGTVVATLLPE